MCQMAGLDIDRLEKMAPSKFAAEMADEWPGLYEKLYTAGHRTLQEMVAEMRRQTQGSCCENPHPGKRKRTIGKDAVAQNDS